MLNSRFALSNTNARTPTLEHQHRYCLQRLSERNYAMRAVVYSTKDSPCGARYTTWKHAKFLKRAVSWLPPSTVRDHHKDRRIVDSFHADLVRDVYLFFIHFNARMQDLRRILHKARTPTLKHRSWRKLARAISQERICFVQ